MICMEPVKTQVTDLMTRIDFPIESQSVFLAALDCIGADKVATAWLGSLMAHYDKSEQCNYKQMLAEAVALGEAVGIHEYTISMLLFLCLGAKLKERYAERGYDEEVYYASMADLRYKLEECRLVKGEVGSFVASWFPGFFNLTRFALGRLQFELIKTAKDWTVDGKLLPAGSRVINMHIPRTGTRLDHALVEDSYRRAAAWFAEELSPTSNMVTFYHDFEVVEWGTYDNYDSIWRFFDCPWTGNVDELPGDSSLRRAYIDLIRRGEPSGWGRGFFAWKA